MADPTPRAGERFTAKQLRKMAKSMDSVAASEPVAAAMLRQAAEDAEVLARMAQDSDGLLRVIEHYRKDLPRG